MKPMDSPSALAALQEVRPAVEADREQLSSLIMLEPHVHKHLDWKAPLDWLGQSPYIVLQEGRRISGALACPPDPESIAWLRLFAFASSLSGSAAWRMLWPTARRELGDHGGGTVAAIATQPWLEPILLENGFHLISQIVLMEMDTRAASLASTPAGVLIRSMLPEDLPRVADLDAAAFEPLWRNSLGALTSAFRQASHASVAEGPSGLLGYHLSTGGVFGTHLARLAVLPEAQRHGVGTALVQDLTSHIPHEREPRLTVNTQSDNSASHALYARLGFRRTGERFPVYGYEVRAADATETDGGGSI